MCPRNEGKPSGVEDPAVMGGYAVFLASQTHVKEGLLNLLPAGYISR
jgi:hypothetical protein